ncbi:MAG: hypothetical protein K1X72_25215 [Pyrinomonadaceae bacterium]|nr:hypothetical protein [Pyrinomonadaceae bacterium]
MKRFFSKKLSICVRTFLLIGLLNGLLFSSGEGIRLFPFPTFETSQSSNFEYQNNQKQNYEKNFHRFDNRSQTYQLKNQKNSDAHSITFASSLRSFVAIRLKAPQIKHFPEQQNIYRSQLFKRNSPSRAPPLF